MHLLVINCGSSSIKFAVFEQSALDLVLSGICDRLGSDSPTITWELGEKSQKNAITLPAGSNHTTAMRAITERIAQELGDTSSFIAVGHRVVHGGERFKAATVIDSEVISGIEACSKLAPLHNPANLVGIDAARKAFPGLPQIAVFDTAFHQTLPPEAYLYPLPYEYYEKHGIRRYGFHGTSHRHVALETAKRLGHSLENTSMISVHLGNGCSAAAIESGVCIDTTMGLTPLEGLVMGTRCGDIDPSIQTFLHRELGMSFAEIDETLNKKSGLLGLSQLSNDMRTLSEAADGGNERARLAIDIFVYRLSKAIASLRSTLANCHAISFTGGIGENAKHIRSRALERLNFLGVNLDRESNETNGSESGRISSENSPVAVYVIPANEELAIAEESLSVINRNNFN